MVGPTPLRETRLLRGSDACQSPRAVKTSLPSLSQQSGAERRPPPPPPRYFLGLLRGCPRAGGGGAGRGLPAPAPRGLCASRPRRPPSQAAGAFCFAQTGRLHHISDTSLSFSPLLLLPAHSPPHTRHHPSPGELRASWTSLPERCLLSRKLPPPPRPPPAGSETKSGGAASLCMSTLVPSGWTPLPGVQSRLGKPETRPAMAEGAAGREGLAPPDIVGGEDDPRVGSDGASGDSVAAAPGGRSRDRRSGVVLPVAAGTPADIDAGLLEAARATPRRSSIIKVSEAAPPRERGCRRWVGRGSPRDLRRLEASQARHCFFPPPLLPNLPSLSGGSQTQLLAMRSRSDFFFFFLTAERKFHSASLRYDGCFLSFSLKASLNR